MQFIQQQPTTAAHRFYVVSQTPASVSRNEITERTISKTKSSYQCGVRKTTGKAVAGLILGGIQASRYDFPWLVAHYHIKDGFLCGGSLVSKKIVTTAAHCVSNKGSTNRIKESDSKYYMGIYNINNLDDEGSVNSDVQNFIVHSDWNPENLSYDSDIAIAVLQKTIVFTETISPICVWTNSVGHEDLVSKRGYVAGNIN